MIRSMLLLTAFLFSQSLFAIDFLEMAELDGTVTEGVSQMRSFEEKGQYEQAKIVSELLKTRVRIAKEETDKEIKNLESKIQKHIGKTDFTPEEFEALKKEIIKCDRMVETYNHYISKNSHLFFEEDTVDFKGIQDRLKWIQEVIALGKELIKKREADIEIAKDGIARLHEIAQERIQQIENNIETVSENIPYLISMAEEDVESLEEGIEVLTGNIQYVLSQAQEAIEGEENHIVTVEDIITWLKEKIVEDREGYHNSIEHREGIIDWLKEKASEQIKDRQEWISNSDDEAHKQTLREEIRKIQQAVSSKSFSYYPYGTILSMEEQIEEIRTQLNAFEKKVADDNYSRYPYGTIREMKQQKVDSLAAIERINGQVADRSYSRYPYGSLAEMDRGIEEKTARIQQINEQVADGSYSRYPYGSINDIKASIKASQQDIAKIKKSVQDKSFGSYGYGSLASQEQNILDHKKAIEEINERLGDGTYSHYPYASINDYKREIEELKKKIADRYNRAEEALKEAMAHYYQKIEEWQNKKLELEKQIALYSEYKELEATKKTYESFTARKFNLDVIYPEQELPLFLKIAVKYAEITEDIGQLKALKKVLDGATGKEKIKVLELITSKLPFMKGKGIILRAAEWAVSEKWMKKDYVQQFFKDFDTAKLLRRIATEAVLPKSKELNIMKAVGALVKGDSAEFLKLPAAQDLIDQVSSQPAIGKLINYYEKYNDIKNDVRKVYDDVKTLKIVGKDTAKDLMVNYVEELTGLDIVAAQSDLRETKAAIMGMEKYTHPENYAKNLTKAFAKSMSMSMQQEFGMGPLKNNVKFRDLLLKMYVPAQQ